MWARRSRTCDIGTRIHRIVLARILPDRVPPPPGHIHRAGSGCLAVAHCVPGTNCGGHRRCRPGMASPEADDGLHLRCDRRLGRRGLRAGNHELDIRRRLLHAHRTASGNRHRIPPREGGSRVETSPYPQGDRGRHRLLGVRSPCSLASPPDLLRLPQLRATCGLAAPRPFPGDRGCLDRPMGSFANPQVVPALCIYAKVSPIPWKGLTLAASPERRGMVGAAE